MHKIPSKGWLILGACFIEALALEVPIPFAVRAAATVPTIIEIRQDSLTLVDSGQTQAYIPFTLCNKDAISQNRDFAYTISGRGHIGNRIVMTNRVSVPANECRDVYGIVDAGSAHPRALDTLTIIAWTTAEPIVYDTCVQTIRVIKPPSVPLYTTPPFYVYAVAVIIIAVIAAGVYLTLQKRKRTK